MPAIGSFGLRHDKIDWQTILFFVCCQYRFIKKEMPLFCDKCLGYVTDKLSFPPHAHDPVMQVLKFKNLVKYAPAIARFLMEWLELCRDNELVNIVETAKMRMTIQNSETILKTNSHGNKFIQEHPQLYSEFVMRELESQVLNFKKEVWQGIWMLAEYNVVHVRKDVDGYFLHWFVQFFLGLWAELPGIHQEHSRLRKPTGTEVMPKKASRPQTAGVIRPLVTPTIARVRTYVSPFQPPTPLSIVVKKDTYIENLDDLYL